jgi:hypothetical protein
MTDQRITLFGSAHVPAPAPDKRWSASSILTVAGASPLLALSVAVLLAPGLQFPVNMYLSIIGAVMCCIQGSQLIAALCSGRRVSTARQGIRFSTRGSAWHDPWEVVTLRWDQITAFKTTSRSAPVLETRAGRAIEVRLQGYTPRARSEILQTIIIHAGLVPYDASGHYYLRSPLQMAAERPPGLTVVKAGLPPGTGARTPGGHANSMS